MKTVPRPHFSWDFDWQEDAHVLDRCNQVILNLLSPEPSPACAFEVMIVSRISKTAFYQMMSPSAVQPCRKAVGLSTRYIQGRLFFVSLHSASMGRASTLRA